MTTGAFWNVDDPMRPWGYFDPDDVINIPVDFTDWLTAEGTTYVGHSLEPAAGLQATTVAPGAVVLMQVSADPAGTLNEGDKYGVTCQIECADGQKRSMTLLLKIREL